MHHWAGNEQCFSKTKTTADRRDRGNVSVIVFCWFFSVVMRAKIRGHEHRKWGLMYLVIEGFVGEVWKLKCFVIINFFSSTS